jgi:GT2 family glycosyltransferase
MTEAPMRLAVLTPSLTGQVHLEHSESMGDLRVECIRRRVHMKRFFNKGCSVLPRTRNVLAASALLDNPDWVLWVDGDIAFTASDVFRLISHDVDIVAAAPQRRTKRWGEAGSVAVDTGGAHPVREANSLVKCKGVATAFMLVRADVFRALAGTEDAPAYKTRDAGPSVTAELFKWFWYEMDDQGFDVGEDYYFCRRAAKHGFQSWCDPDVRLRHFEGMVEHSLSLADVMEAVHGNAG